MKDLTPSDLVRFRGSSKTKSPMPVIPTLEEVECACGIDPYKQEMNPWDTKSQDTQE